MEIINFIGGNQFQWKGNNQFHGNNEFQLKGVNGGADRGDESEVSNPGGV